MGSNNTMSQDAMFLYGNPTQPVLMNHGMQLITSGSFKRNQVLDLSTVSPHIDETCPNKLTEERAPERDDPTRTSAGFFKTNLNGIVLLVGLGALSSPYALSASGWVGILIAFTVGACYLRAAYFMFKCQEKDEKLLNYQDLAYKTLPRCGRLFSVILFYFGTLGSLVAFSISAVDNLCYIFPNPDIGFLNLRGRFLFIIVSSTVIMPTTWIKNLRTISFLSFSSLTCFVITVMCLLWIGISDVGFDQNLPLLKLAGIPAATGIFAYSYGGNGVFPTIYTSMKNRPRYPMVLAVSYITAFLCYSVLGIIGVLMFGESNNLQVTLSMPRTFLASRVAMWATVVTPITKFALHLCPASIEIEGWFLKYLSLTEKSWHANAMSVLVRTLILIFVVLIASFLPYFGYVIGLTGCASNAAVCCVFPCIFYIRSHRQDLTKAQVIEVYALIVITVTAGLLGSVVAFKGIIESKLRS